MNTKLTLQINNDVIEKAKSYAKEKHISLSTLVENFLHSLAGDKEKFDMEISPVVQELSGIIELPEDFNLKKEYTEYLIEKYT
ncbi:MAG: hypothetical protein HUU32_08510 [Calditrichaceae bacterium]|nr:DUF6364 family protein [Calditrichia bacterium]NUQ41419.1 hypothetical protein [Calditrichaceae bacterium]